MTPALTGAPAHASERHAAVISLRLAGVPQSQIARETGYSQAAVSRIIAAYEAEMLRATVPGAATLSTPELVTVYRILTALAAYRAPAARVAILRAALAAVERDAAPAGESAGA